MTIPHLPSLTMPIGFDDSRQTSIRPMSLGGELAAKVVQPWIVADVVDWGLCALWDFVEDGVGVGVE